MPRDLMLHFKEALDAETKQQLVTTLAQRLCVSTGAQRLRGLAWLGATRLLLAAAL